MSASIILFIFIFIVILIIFLEYRNEQKYQNKRREKRPKSTRKKPKEPIKKKPREKKKPQKEPEPHIEEVEKVQPEVVPEPGVEPEEAIEVKPEEVEEVVETKELPACKYPPFTHVRLVEMGLSDDEATEFVNELIPQLEEQIPLIEEAINIADFHQIERLTHGIKGSATNLGTGGISDLLVEYNTYLKSGTDSDIVKTYHKHFVHYIEDLKKQYA